MILDISLPELSLKARVCREILIAISCWNKKAYFKNLKDIDDLKDSILKTKSKIIVSLYALPIEVSDALRELGIIQIIIGRNDDLLNYADIFIDPLEPKSFQHFFGTDFLPVEDLSQNALTEISQYFETDRNEFVQKLSTNRAKDSLCEILQVFKLLDWDSSFFGFNIGYVSCRRLTKNIESYIKERSKELNIDMIQYNCNCHDQVSILTAEENGYSFVDVRVTFELMLQNIDYENDDLGDVIFRKGEQEDIDKLRNIAGEIYTLSRYYFDRRFDQDKVREFYEGWLEKGIKGEFDDYCFIVEVDGRPVAFTTVKESADGTADIGIVGVDKDYSGRSLGTILIKKVIEELKRKNLTALRVVTQGRNYPAQRLYQKSGFITNQMELWYHKWLNG
tara:strand:- start:2802 stop:3980 length:1179 start_codon:yes stop_codon:yes gene_type:complete